MNDNYQKETQTKLTKGLLDMIVLQYLEEESKHGYQIISIIRKGFGVNLGPSTVYPLLGLLEKKGYVTSVWNLCTVRPRKMFKLTTEGKNILNFTENSLKLIVKNMGSHDKIWIQPAPLIYARPTLQRENPILSVC